MKVCRRVKTIFRHRKFFRLTVLLVFLCGIGVYKYKDKRSGLPNLTRATTSHPLVGERRQDAGSRVSSLSNSFNENYEKDTLKDKGVNSGTQINGDDDVTMCGNRKSEWNQGDERFKEDEKGLYLVERHTKSFETEEEETNEKILDDLDEQDEENKEEGQEDKTFETIEKHSLRGITQQLYGKVITEQLAAAATEEKLIQANEDGLKLSHSSDLPYKYHWENEKENGLKITKIGSMKNANERIKDENENEYKQEEELDAEKGKQESENNRQTLVVAAAQDEKELKARNNGSNSVEVETSRVSDISDTSSITDHVKRREANGTKKNKVEFSKRKSDSKKQKEDTQNGAQVQKEEREDKRRDRYSRKVINGMNKSEQWKVIRTPPFKRQQTTTLEEKENGRYNDQQGDRNGDQVNQHDQQDSDEESKGGISRAAVQADKPATSEDFLRRRQDERKQILTAYCQKHPVELQLPSKSEMKHLVVLDEAELIYCSIPKVASTEWREALSVYNNHKGIQGKQAQNRTLWKHLNEYSYRNVTEKLLNYYKFLFVREPFARLLSAYRSKFESKNEYFHRTLGRQIIQKFRKNATEHAKNFGDDVTFLEFMKSIVYGVYHDEHWRPYDQLCHVCSVGYDFIGHLETIDEDGPLVLQQARIYNRVRFKSRRRSRTSSMLLSYYSQIPISYINRLRHIYLKDFEMFGYQFPGPLKSLVSDI